jgi:hypothetical protein
MFVEVSALLSFILCRLQIRYMIRLQKTTFLRADTTATCTIREHNFGLFDFSKLLSLEFVLFLVEKSLANINCLLVCRHFSDWSKNNVKTEGTIFHISIDLEQK